MGTTTEHWLLFDRERRIAGCHCGFMADVENDCGYGDSVVEHLLSESREVTGTGEYMPPEMSNGKTWADSPWWSGHTWDNPQTVEEARELAWARCWAYGEAMGMTTREWHLMWPIVYGALNALSRVGAENPEPTYTPAPRMTEPETSEREAS